MTEILLFLVGIVVGAMNSVAGGGMLIGFPALLAVGVPPLMANATGNLITLPGQLASAFGYRKYLRKLPHKYLVLLIPCLVGSIAGALVLRNTSHAQFEAIVPGLIFAAVALFAIQPFLHFHLHRHITKKSRKSHTLVWISIALLPVSFYGGYFGPGFGFIMLAFLGFTSINDVHKMNALKNIGSAVICLSSFICLWGAGLFNWKYGLVMAAGSIIGGYSGARIAQRFSSHAIRIIVIVIGFTAAAYLAHKAYMP